MHIIYINFIIAYQVATRAHMHMHACMLALADLDSKIAKQPIIIRDIWKYVYDATSMHMHVLMEI